jgi:ECF transporter S component (folate family)
MKKNNLKIIACVSIMAALAVVLKSFGIMIGDSMRISFFAVPLMIAGLIGGFGWGLVAALAADMIYGFFFNPFGFNPIYTISALLWGVVGGILKVYSKKHNKLPWLFLTGVILISSLLETSNNALWDFVLYDKGTTLVLFGYKLIAIAIKLPIIVLLIKLLNDRVLKLIFKQEA